MNTCTLFRTCVDETQLCKGKRLCMNGNDLKWCKDEWKFPSLNFKHFQERDGKEHSKCTKSFAIDFVPNGQDILAEDIRDGLFYNCFNRADEDPFKKIGYNQSDDGVDKSWSDWARIPCQNKYYRRCLGSKPSQCVFGG